MSLRDSTVSVPAGLPRWSSDGRQRRSMTEGPLRTIFG
jgi:hypothetical protein